jgi:hypothetical protein
VGLFNKAWCHASSKSRPAYVNDALRAGRSISAPLDRKKNWNQRRKDSVLPGRKQDLCDFVAGKSGKAKTRGQRKCKKLQLHIDMEHNSDKVATAICSEKKYQNN